jgi:hypothetical protein
MKPESNLAFDVNPAECLGSCGIEVTLGLARLEVDNGITLRKEILGVVLDKELVRIAVGIETKFLGDETKRNICLVTVPRTMSALSASKLALEDEEWKLTLCTCCTVQRGAHDRQTCP